MTTSPGWEPRPGPTRGDTARRAPREAAGGRPATGQDATRNGNPANADGRGRDDYDPRGQRDRAIPPGDRGRAGERGSRGDQGRDDRSEPPGRPRFTPSRPARTGGGGQGGTRLGDGLRPGRPVRPRGARLAGRPLVAMPDGLDALRSSPLLRWLGAMSLRNAALAFVACLLAGIAITIIVGSEPGGLLGLFIIAGSIVATLGVRHGAVHIFFPLPALAFCAGAVVTGAVHDTSLESSTAGLGAGALQWFAGIFIPMCVATIVVLVIGGARWLLGKQLVTGQFLMSDRRPGTSPGRISVPRARPRPAVSDPWTAQDRTAPRRDSDPRAAQDRTAPRRDSDPRAAQDGTDDREPRPASGQPRPRQASAPRPGSARPARGQRDDRDPWGDPRPPIDRDQAPGTSRPRPGTRQPGQAPPRQQPRPQRSPRAPRDP